MKSEKKFKINQNNNHLNQMPRQLAANNLWGNKCEGGTKEIYERSTEKEESKISYAIDLSKFKNLHDMKNAVAVEIMANCIWSWFGDTERLSAVKRAEFQLGFRDYPMSVMAEVNSPVFARESIRVNGNVDSTPHRPLSADAIHVCGAGSCDDAGANVTLSRALLHQDGADCPFDFRWMPSRATGLRSSVCPNHEGQ